MAGFEDEEFQRVTFLQAHIRLMLNPNEDDHRRLEELMRRMVIAASRPGPLRAEKAKIDEFPGLLVEVVTLSRKIFKREWDRVKEPILAETSHS